MDEKKLVGTVTHYFSKIGVAVIELADTLKVGDRIVFDCGGHSFEQTVESMQVEHKPVSAASKGQSVGLKVAEKVHEGNKVYKA